MKPLRRRRQEPQNFLTRFQDEMNDLFNRFNNDLFSFNDSFFDQRHSFMPALNVEETDHAYIVEVELPGLDAEDVNIEIKGNVLTISGEKEEKTETKEDVKRTYVVERKYGSFQRSFTLPDDADINKIEATSKKGVFTINIPKDETKETKRIEIRKQD